MGLWPEGSRKRMQDAALELFADRVYAATTVDDIAARAGVSPRTFFRHFRDKEEVLFDADAPLLAAVVDGVRAAPADAAPRVLVTAGLRALARTLDADRVRLRVRADVLASDIALQGRDLAKQARWVAVVADEVAGRGVPHPTATLLTAAAAAAFRTTYLAWLADDAGPGLEERCVRALDELAAVLCRTGPAPGGPTPGGPTPGGPARAESNEPV